MVYVETNKKRDSPLVKEILWAYPRNYLHFDSLQLNAIVYWWKRRYFNVDNDYDDTKHGYVY